MRMSRIEIRDFRSIRHLALELGNTTVFIGPNNVGKTAILDALRLALTRRWGQTGTRFRSTDIHELPDQGEEECPSTGSIALNVEESAPGEWPRSTAKTPHSTYTRTSSDGCRSLALRIQFGPNTDTARLEEQWQILDAQGQPIPAQDAFPTDDWRWRHLPVFYLDTSRQLDEIVLPKPRFWEQYLSALEVPVELEVAAESVLASVYTRLREADPRTKGIMHAIVQRNPLALNRRDGPDPGMLPGDMFNDLHWMDSILDAGSDDHPYSFNRQSLATQSLAVMNLARAFGRYLHREAYGPKSWPVLILEEPEAHLSPQTARLLWRHVRTLPGQKIITTHSPYFVQHVPFRDLRLVRLTAGGTEVKSLPSSFSASIPDLDGLDREIQRSDHSLTYDRSTATLTVAGMLRKKTYRRLLGWCGARERRDLVPVLKDLCERSSRYVADHELRSLETFARRIRGEIFFSEAWIIVEGQADHVLVHALAHAMRYDLDWQSVSVIDAQNNGSPQAFAVLARALHVPWVAVFDGDDAGNRYVEQLAKRGFSKAQLQSQCLLHAAGDLEAQLVADGLGEELRDILAQLGVSSASGLSDDKLAEELRANKASYAPVLADRFRLNRRVAQRGPEAFRTAISMLSDLRTDQHAQRTVAPTQ